MANSAGVITLKLRGDVAELFTDIDRANGKLVEFKNSAERAGGAGVSGVQATSAALRVMEGGLNNNLRAAERFVSNVLGLGPLLQAAFPIAGALAFAGLFGKMTEEAAKFFREVHDAPEKISGAFRQANASILLSNDELRLANDRIENDIARLSGHRENGLKVALDEAREMADKLGQSLDRDISAVHKLLTENQIDRVSWRSLLGEASTQDIGERLGGRTGLGGFGAEIAQKIADARAQIKPGADTKVIEDQLRRTLEAAYDLQIASFRDQLAKAEEAAKPHLETIVDRMGVEMGTREVSGENTTVRQEALQGVIRNLMEQRISIPLMVENAGLSSARDKLQAGRENMLADKPLTDMLKRLDAQIDGVQTKLAAIGQGDTAQVLAKAFGDSAKAIEEVNRGLEKHGRQLTDAEKEQIKEREVTIAQTEAETAWRDKFAASTIAIQDRIESQRALTAAIGQGFAATREANIQTRLMQELGEHFYDQQWMTQHAGNVAQLRSDFGTEFDAQHAEQVAQTVQKLKDQIATEQALARVQSEGAEAVRQATLAAKLHQIARDNDAASARKLIAAEIELYNAQRTNATEEEVTKINEKTEATERLAAATLKGAEAVREARLQNQVATIMRDSGGPTVDAAARIQAATDATKAEYDQELATTAARADRVHTIDDEISKLQDAKQVYGDTLAIEIELRDLENQRLKALAQQALQWRGAQDGVRAFFLEMQTDAKSAAQIVYDSLNGALDRVSANAAKAATGQKTEWAKSFRQLGEEMIQAETKSTLQHGLGLIGKMFGVDIGSLGKPDGSRGNPIWVRNADGVGGHVAVPWQGPQLPGAGGGGSSGSGGSGGSSSPWDESLPGGANLQNVLMNGLGITNFGGYRDSGGGVEPGQAYEVGESRPEIFVPGERGSILPDKMGGNVTINSPIDARGADLGAWNRINAGMQQMNRLTMARAIQAMREYQMRVPQ